MLHVTFILHVSIVSGFWCKLLYILVIYCSYLYSCKLNVLFLLCISITLIACVSYFIQWVSLFDL